METTLLWESPIEKELKEEKLLGRPAWEYTKELFQATGCEYRECREEDYWVVRFLQGNRAFLVEAGALPKKPVLYFLGHYPSLPAEVLRDFLQAQAGEQLALLSLPSDRWLGEKEPICFLWRPSAGEEGAESPRWLDAGKEEYSEGTGQKLQLGGVYAEQTMALLLSRLNSKKALPSAECELRQKNNREWMEKGVEFADIDSIQIDHAAEIEAGAFLCRGARISGSSVIGANCYIGANCEVKDSKIESGSRIVHSCIENSQIGEGCEIGPFSYIKAGSVIGRKNRIIQSRLEGCRTGEGCEIGAFSQIKAGSEISKGSRIIQSYMENSQIGEGCEIGPFSCIKAGSEIGRKNRIIQSQLESCRTGEACNIGPFSYIRPDSVIGERVRIGDFVEIKNSVIGEDTMISHLTYVGDADVGKNVNFGCGTVLVNYDGMHKHRSVIEDNAFIGCNSNLVSPVHIGKGAFIAAGSTITEDLPANSLGIARARQQIKENWVTNRKDNEGGKNK